MRKLNEIKATSSGYQKQLILGTFTEREKKVLFYTYTPEYTYGINMPMYLEALTGEPSDEMFQLLDKLRLRELTGNAARDALQEFVRAHGTLIAFICNKNLRIGLAHTQINKIFRGLITEFKIGLASPLVGELSGAYMVQEKFDGIRVIAMVDNGEVSFRTRGNKEFTYDALAAEIRKLNLTKGFLDGELVLDRQGSVHSDIAGYITSSNRSGISVPCDLAIKYKVFDLIDYEAFVSQQLTNGYRDRYKELASLHWHNCSRCELISTLTLSNPEHIYKVFNEIVDKGGEGLILKKLDSHYPFKRSPDWIKLKKKDTADMLCIGVEEGEGKYTGMIGKLLVEGEINGQFISTKVGSGLTDYDRSQDENHFIGKVIEVDYADISSTGTSLMHPRFIRIREDKSDE